MSANNPQPPQTTPQHSADSTDDTCVPVPRIGIQAFCESAEATEAIRRAGIDQRLAKTHMSLHMGGIAAALDLYKDRPTPNLIILEATDTGETLINQLDSLAQTVDGGTNVLIIGTTNDVRLYRNLIKRGVESYLVKPIEPPELVEAIAAIYDDPSTKPLGRVFAFAGTRGGAGSSTIAHNIAWSLNRQHGFDVTLADLDLPFGTAALNFNHDPGPGLSDALTSGDRLDDMVIDRLLVSQAEGFRLLTAPASLDHEINPPGETYASLFDLLRGSARIVILDLPHIWSDWTRRCLTLADEAVITTTPDLAGLRNTKTLFDLLTHERSGAQKPRLILNQTGIPKRPEIPPKEFAEAAGTEPAAIVPFEPALFTIAANNGQMLGEVNASARPAELFRALAHTLSGREERALAKPADGLMTRLFKRKSA